jgi:hypothetical protein
VPTSPIRRPTKTTINISRGNWIVVKDHLTAGDQRSVMKGSLKRVRTLDGKEVEEVDVINAPLVQAATYLLDWSVRDPDGNPVSIKGLTDEQMISVLGMLEPEDCNEICRVIDEHDDAMRALRAAEKKAADGETKSPATSPSPSTSAGDTSGSPSSMPTSTKS